MTAPIAQRNVDLVHRIKIAVVAYSFVATSLIKNSRVVGGFL